TEAIAAEDSGNHDRQAQQARKLGPVGGDESEERGSDEKTADDGHNHRYVYPGSERRKGASDAGADRRRYDAIGLPSRQISLKPLPIGPVEHRHAPTKIAWCRQGQAADTRETPRGHRLVTEPFGTMGSIIDREMRRFRRVGPRSMVPASTPARRIAV